MNSDRCTEQREVALRPLLLVPMLLGQLLVFALAVVVFFLGLGVGLALFPPLGMLLWVVALGIAGLNVLWILRSWRQYRQGSWPSGDIQAVKGWILRSRRQER